MILVKKICFSSYQSSIRYICSKKSGQQDLNLRPLGPQPSALPSYAILRHVQILLYAILTCLSSAYFILLKHTMKISQQFQNDARQEVHL